jgi:hypothetical protein
MLNRKQLPLVAKLGNLKIDVSTVLAHCQNNNLLDPALYNDIKYSASSKHQAFVVSNEFCKTNFFTESESPIMEGELYKQLYLTDFDESKASNKVSLHGTNIFERTKRLDPKDSRYLPEADELNYGVRNKYAVGPFADILNMFKSTITRVRLAYLTAGFNIKPHVDYDPSYITRYHIPLITNDDVIMGFTHKNQDYRFNIPADGSIYFFNSGIKHRVENNSTENRLHLIIDTHGQLDLQNLINIEPRSHTVL